MATDSSPGWSVRVIPDALRRRFTIVVVAMVLTTGVGGLLYVQTQDALADQVGASLAVSIVLPLLVVGGAAAVIGRRT